MNLKELLGEELYNQLMEKLGDKHKVAIISDGNWIPKEKFDNLNEEKKQYKTQVDDLNRQLGELQGKLKDNEDANQTIEDLKKQIESKETELANTRKVNAVKLEVLKANPNDVVDILPHLKDEAITLSEDGTITGLEEQLRYSRRKSRICSRPMSPMVPGAARVGAPEIRAAKWKTLGLRNISI